MVHLRKGRRQISKYWDFNPSEEIRYRSDQNTRSIFEQYSRTPCGGLTFGYTSSRGVERGHGLVLHVCVADAILARKHTGGSILETVSYYDNSEPNWENPLTSLWWKRVAGAGATLTQVPQSSTRLTRVITVLPPSQALQKTPGWLRAIRHPTLRQKIFGSSSPESAVTSLWRRSNTPYQNSRSPGTRTVGSSWPAHSVLGAGNEDLVSSASKHGEAFCLPRPPVCRSSSDQHRGLSPTFVRRSRVVWEGNAVRLKMFGPCRAFQRTSQP